MSQKQKQTLAVWVEQKQVKHIETYLRHILGNPVLMVRNAAGQERADVFDENIAEGVPLQHSWSCLGSASPCPCCWQRLLGLGGPTRLRILRLLGLASLVNLGLRILRLLLGLAGLVTLGLRILRLLGLGLASLVTLGVLGDCWTTSTGWLRRSLRRLGLGLRLTDFRNISLNRGGRRLGFALSAGRWLDISRFRWSLLVATPSLAFALACALAAPTPFALALALLDGCILVAHVLVLLGLAGKLLPPGKNLKQEGLAKEQNP